MAPTTNNRYALFSEKDGQASPVSKPATDVSRNPFLNQVVDDSIPWQEVKKRGASPEQRRAHQTAVKTLVIKGRAKAVPNHTHAGHSHPRDISGSTNTGNDKPHDSHENWCGVCLLKFPSKTALQTHIKQSPEHQNYCNLCKRVFKDRNGLKNHVDNSWDHDICCNLCLSAFKDEWGLKNHFENNYHVGHEFVCLTCLLGFKSQVEMERHLQTAAKHTWCESCCRRFRNQDERNEHWQKTTRHRHCLQPGCDFDCTDHAALSEHLKRDHFQCEGCKHILPSQTKLPQHCENCSFNLFCSQCGEACAGEARLALHLEHCFFCEECDFQTHHKGTFEAHMTKHASDNIPCWGCDTPMRSYLNLIQHLESGKCSKLSDPTLLTRCLGRWWYSALYMDLDIHAQIRTERIDVQELQQWLENDLLQPYMCRGQGCRAAFANLSSLVRHLERQTCDWDIARLNVPGLQKEVVQNCLKRDSATA